MPLDVDAIADAVVLMVQTAIAPFAERLAVLETKAADVVHVVDLDLLRANLTAVIEESRIPGPPGPAGADGKDGAPGLNGKDGAPGLRYCGVYVPGETYALGDVVTWAGSAWHCKEPTNARPDDAARPWQLIVKAGKDGRDRRVEAAH